MIARKGMASKSVSRLVSPVDIAPTIAEYLQIDYPSGVVGKPLKELVEGN
jgi:arylsulfatase A-like enzyme